MKRTGDTRKRSLADHPEVEPEVTEHTIHSDWCPKCKKKVELPVPDALPGSQLGNRVLVLSAWQHFAVGNTRAQSVEVFEEVMGTAVGEANSSFSSTSAGPPASSPRPSSWNPR